VGGGGGTGRKKNKDYGEVTKTDPETYVNGLDEQTGGGKAVYVGEPGQRDVCPKGTAKKGRKGK